MPAHRVRNPWTPLGGLDHRRLRGGSPTRASSLTTERDLRQVAQRADDTLHDRDLSACATWPFVIGGAVALGRWIEQDALRIYFARA